MPGVQSLQSCGSWRQVTKIPCKHCCEIDPRQSLSVDERFGNVHQFQAEASRAAGHCHKDKVQEIEAVVHSQKHTRVSH